MPFGYGLQNAIGTMQQQPEAQPNVDQAKVAQLLAERQANQGGQGLNALIGFIKNIGVNRELERYRPQLQALRQKEMDVADRRTKLELDTKQARLDVERENLDKVHEETKKRQGLMALDRVSRSIGAGKQFDMGDAQAAGIMMRPDGQVLTNADLLAARGLDPKKISRTNLALQFILKNPASPHSQEQLMKAVQDETDFQQSLAKVSASAKKGSVDDLRGNFTALSQMGGRIGSQMSAILKAKNDILNPIGDDEALNLFQQSVLPMAKAMNQAAKAFGIDAGVDVTKLGRAIMANDPVSVGEELQNIGEVNNQLQIEAKKPANNAAGTKANKPPLNLADKKPDLKSAAKTMRGRLNELSDEELLKMFLQR